MKLLKKYLQGYSPKEVEKDFDEVMAKVKSRPVLASDEMPSSRYHDPRGNVH